MGVSVDELSDYEDKPSPSLVEIRKRLDGPAPTCHQTKLRTLEITASPQGGPCTEGEVDDTSIKEWFSRSHSPRVEEHHVHSAAPGKLRLLYGKVEAGRFPFSRKGFQVIAEYLALSMRHFRILNSEHDSVMRLYNDRREDEVCTNYCTRSSVFYDGGEHGYNSAVTHLFIHHNPTTHLTQGLLLQTEFIRHQEHEKLKPTYLEDIIASLKSNSRLAGHDPFFSATTLCKCALPLHQRIVLILSSRINKLNKDLVQQRPKKTDDQESSELDFVEETTKIQSKAQQLGILREMIERQLLVLGRIPEDTKAILRHCHECDGSKEAKKIEKLSKGIMDDVQMVSAGIRTDNQAMLKWIDRETLTIASLRQTVYNYMALEEQRLTTSLTLAARKDSSAMKTIAALTMIFLPGTAIASILDTPFFVYDESLSKIITRQFWMFWAITIPITIVVVLVWRAAVYFSGTKWLKVLLYGKRRMRREKEDDVEKRAMSNGSKFKEPALMA